MKAMILAAGFGTRLRPLTHEIPKPAVPVLGKPLCAWNMEFLRDRGIDSFVLNLHHRPMAIRQAVDGWAKARKIDVVYSVEPEILGTGGGLRQARPLLGDGTFLSMNGDALVGFDFDALLAFHRAKGALATLLLFPDPTKRYTPVTVGDDGRLLSFSRDFVPPAGARRGFFTGVQLVEPEVLDLLPGDGARCIVRDAYAPLAASGGPIFGFVSDGSFLDFGTPADYLDGTISLLRRSGGTSFVGRRASIAPDAIIGTDAVVESGASVDAGAVVTESIIWPGARVAAGETVHRTIVTPTRRVVMDSAQAKG